LLFKAATVPSRKTLAVIAKTTKPMTKIHIFRLFILIGIINALTVIIGALTGENAYTIANNLSDYFYLLLCFMPLGLTSIALIWFLIDKYVKTEERPNYFALAFAGILADAVFVIGSFLFASGH
jgi:hypothetical protein